MLSELFAFILGNKSADKNYIYHDASNLKSNEPREIVSGTCPKCGASYSVWSTGFISANCEHLKDTKEKA